MIHKGKLGKLCNTRDMSWLSVVNTSCPHPRVVSQRSSSRLSSPPPLEPLAEQRWRGVWRDLPPGGLTCFTPTYFPPQTIAVIGRLHLRLHSPGNHRASLSSSLQTLFQTPSRLAARSLRSCRGCWASQGGGKVVGAKRGHASPFAASTKLRRIYSRVSLSFRH